MSAAATVLIWVSMIGITCVGALFVALLAVIVLKLWREL